MAIEIKTLAATKSWGRGKVYNDITETIGQTPLVRLQRLSQIRLPHAGGRESLCQCSDLHPSFMIPNGQRLDFLPQPIMQALGIDESSARRLGILAVAVDIFEQSAFGAGGALLDALPFGCVDALLLGERVAIGVPLLDNAGQA